MQNRYSMNPSSKRPSTRDPASVAKRYQASRAVPESTQPSLQAASQASSQASAGLPPSTFQVYNRQLENQSGAQLVLASTTLANHPGVPSSCSAELRTPLTKLLESGYHHVLDAVYDFELSRGHPHIQELGNKGCRRHGLAFIASLHHEVLLGIIRGTLAEQWRNGDEELVKLYGVPSANDMETTAWMYNASMVAPGHYLRLLVDARDGLPPTPNELQQAIDVMRKYVDSSGQFSDIATAVDNIRRTSAGGNAAQVAKGQYYFISRVKKGADRARCQSRIDAIIKFCDTIELRLRQVPANLRDKPDIRPLAYAGYAIKIIPRLEEHDEPDKSSYIMSLLENIFQYLKLSYRWESFPVSFAIGTNESQLGEIIINTLAQGYSDSGFGVAPHPAGINCSSSTFAGKSGSDINACWEAAKSFRHTHTPYEANMHEFEKLLKEGDKLRAIQRTAELQRNEADVEEFRKHLATNDPTALRKLRDDLISLESASAQLSAPIAVRYASFRARLDSAISRAELTCDTLKLSIEALSVT